MKNCREKHLAKPSKKFSCFGPFQFSCLWHCGNIIKTNKQNTSKFVIFLISLIHIPKLFFIFKN